jgi:hypothetical protein
MLYFGGGLSLYLFGGVEAAGVPGVEPNCSHEHAVDDGLCPLDE